MHSRLSSLFSTVSPAYDAVGNRESVSYPNGNVTLYDYDALSRLTRLAITDAADQILTD